MNVAEDKPLPRPRIAAPLRYELTLRERCPSCRVAVGGTHKSGCDVEVCSACAGQRLLCRCATHQPSLTVWTGYWPGALACIELGWFSRFVHGVWMRCGPNDKDAGPDLNRWGDFVRKQRVDGAFRTEEPKATARARLRAMAKRAHTKARRS